MAKQAKYLEERLKLQQKEDEDEGPSEGEDAEEEARERLWGTSKGAYYGGDDAEVRMAQAVARRGGVAAGSKRGSAAGGCGEQSCALAQAPR